ncbi:hypothetical protein H5410_036251, partial [Solanum commersonii]
GLATLRLPLSPQEARRDEIAHRELALGRLAISEMASESLTLRLQLYLTSNSWLVSLQSSYCYLTSSLLYSISAFLWSIISNRRRCLSFYLLNMQTSLLSRVNLGNYPLPPPPGFTLGFVNQLACWARRLGDDVVVRLLDKQKRCRKSRCFYLKQKH